MRSSAPTFFESHSVDFFSPGATSAFRLSRCPLYSAAVTECRSAVSCAAPACTCETADIGISKTPLRHNLSWRGIPLGQFHRCAAWCGPRVGQGFFKKDLDVEGSFR